MSSVNGSRTAVLSSGIRIMSDSLMPFQPAMEEPSNIWPSSKKSSSTAVAGRVTCCSLPLVSVKRRSTHFASLFLIRFRVCSDIGFPPWGVKSCHSVRRSACSWCGGCLRAPRQRPANLGRFPKSKTHARILRGLSPCFVAVYHCRSGGALYLCSILMRECIILVRRVLGATRLRVSGAGAPHGIAAECRIITGNGFCARRGAEV